MANQRLELKNPVGVNKALNAADLPMDVWSDVRNVRFKDGKSSKAQGYERVFSSLPADVLYLTPYLNQNTPFWIASTPTKIYRTEGGTPIDISRAAPYNADEDHSWVGGVLNQVVCLTNGVDIPQALLPNATNFQDLPNWPNTHRAKVIRPYKNYLIALNITANSVDQNTTVKWSSPADPGEVPFTWDVNDPTSDAGENFLADTPGAILDGRKLKDSFIIYKEDSVYSMRYIGGTFVFQFQQLFDDIGVLSRNCVAEFDAKHFVVGFGDVYVHNGVQKQSIIEGEMKDYLFSSMNPEAVQRTFVVPDYASSEMWICYSSSANDTKYCDRAIIWNWRNNKWTIRDLPQVFYGTFGIVDPQDPDNWDSDPNAWNTDTTVWGDAKYNPAKMKLVFTSTHNDKCYLIGDTSLFDGSSFDSRLEKTDIYLGDDKNMKVAVSMTPHMQGTGVARISIGSAMIQNGPITWKGPYLYNIGQQHKIDFRVQGRYLAVKYEIDSSGSWTLNGFTVELAPNAGEK